MIYRYAEIKDLDEIMGLYKEASLNEWCTWDDSYPDTGICKKDIETESLLCLEDNGTIIAAISFDSDDIVEPAYLENLVKKSVETSSDITVCGFFNFSDDAEGVENLVYYPNEEFEQEDFIEHVFARGRWTKSIGGGGWCGRFFFLHMQ